jgi:hypothetical protein
MPPISMKLNRLKRMAIKLRKSQIRKSRPPKRQSTRLMTISKKRRHTLNS